MFTPLVATATRTASDDWKGMTGHVNRPMIETIAPDSTSVTSTCAGRPASWTPSRGSYGDEVQRREPPYESFAGVRTSRAGKPAPMTAVHLSSGAVLLAEDEAEEAAGSLTVEFARSAKQATTDGTRTLLDLAEAHDLDIGYGCRAGSCGDCKVRVISGRVEMDSEDGLQPDEKAGGYVLTCVGRPATDCVVDA